MTHDNRNWQRRWTVDLEAQTATHIDGWVVHFTPTDDGGFDGKGVAQPDNLTMAQMMAAPRIMQEAAEAWLRARKERQ